MIDLNEQEIDFISGGVDIDGYPSSDPDLTNPLKKPGPYNAYYAM